MTNLYSVNKLIFFLVLLVLTSCEDRSEIQIKESEELYECLCNNMAIELAIDRFKDDVKSYYKNDIPEEFFLTNPCYLELFYQKNSFNQKFKEKSKELQKLNLGYISDDQERINDKLGYIKGSDYEIHILKPAQRRLSKHCRKPYNNFDSEKCFSKPTKGEHNLWDKPIEKGNQISSVYNSSGYVKNGLYNWLSTIKANRDYSEQNRVLQYQYFNDRHTYSIFKETISYKCDEDILSLKIQDSKNFNICLTEFKHLSPDNIHITEDEEGNTYVSRTIETFKDQQLIIYKLDVENQQLNLYKTFPLEKQVFYEGGNQKTAVIANGLVFFIGKKLFAAAFHPEMLFGTYSSTSNVRYQPIPILLELTEDNEAESEILPIGEKIEFLRTGLPNYYPEINEVKVIDQNNILISLIDDGDRNIFCVVKYNLLEKEADVVLNGEANYNYSEFKLDQMMINEESNLQTIWYAVKNTDEEYQINFSSDKGEHWNSFMLPLNTN